MYSVHAVHMDPLLGRSHYRPTMRSYRHLESARKEAAKYPDGYVTRLGKSTPLWSADPATQRLIESAGGLLK